MHCRKQLAVQVIPNLIPSHWQLVGAWANVNGTEAMVGGALHCLYHKPLSLDKWTDFVTFNPSLSYDLSSSVCVKSCLSINLEGMLFG